MKTDKLIPASAFVVLTTGVIGSVQNGNNLPNASFWIGIAIAYMFISLMALFNPDLGAGLSILAMVSSLLVNGESIAKFAGERTQGKIGSAEPVSDQQRAPRRTVISPRPQIRYI